VYEGVLVYSILGTILYSCILASKAGLSFISFNILEQSSATPLGRHSYFHSSKYDGQKYRPSGGARVGWCCILFKLFSMAFRAG
jgi:hypothetical protein